ncbi:MAG: ACT domain-containing protein, partial [Clostridiales bacterium]|nr:ACT domain-containing protein [Clostridiales bacterium]
SQTYTHTVKGEGRGIIVKGHSDLLVRMAKCCSPVPGDAIIGFISRGRGITIHRDNCPNIKNAESFRLIEAHWDKKSASPFAVALTIEGKDTGGVLAKITKTVSDMKLSIESLTARVVDKEQKAVISLSIRINNPDQLDSLINKIQSIRNVYKVYRTMN